MDKGKHLEPRFSTGFGKLAMFIMKNKQNIIVPRSDGLSTTLSNLGKLDNGSILSVNFSDINSEIS